LQPWAWNGIHLMLPDDWEMIQFSKDPRAGRCAFADRYQLRFELNWAAVDGPPDFARMVSDYKAKLEAEGVSELRSVQHAPWYGVFGREDKLPISRYGAFFPARSILVEIVFLWPEGQKANNSFEGRVMDKIQVPTPNDSGMCQWRAFGIEAILPEKHELEQCNVHTAYADMLFTDPKKRSQETFLRRGMLSQWLDQPLPDWLESKLPPGYKIVSRRQSTHAGHECWQLEARIARPVLKDWLWGARRYQACVWICPEDKRLYLLSRIAHQAKNAPHALPDIRMACCPAQQRGF
jgi:hypothetical protein